MKRMLLWMLVAGVWLWAQSPVLPEFDVASVKPSPPAVGDSISINLGTAVHGVVKLTNTTLSECLRWAYGLSNEDQLSGPDWMRDRALRVDIEAKAPLETPIEQMRLMMQRLLIERFRLEWHREQRSIPHFELTVAKGGAKLRRSAGEPPSVNKGYGRGRLNFERLTMPTMAMLLSRQLREPVIDRTGIQGAYDVNLEWAPEDTPLADAGALPDLYSAMERQLGLRLERRKTPLEVIVIDAAQKQPVAN